MRRFLDKLEDQSISSESLCKLSNIVLKNNYFGSGKDLNRQIIRTAIGTKFAPHYDKIFMASLGEDMSEKYYFQS